MQLRILDIHGNVETVTKEREATIMRLSTSLESNEVVRKELYQKYIAMEERYKESSREAARLQGELKASAEALSSAQAERKQVEANHKAALQEMKAAHKLAVERMKNEHSKQMHDLHEHSTVEIVKFRDDISSAVVQQQEATRKRNEEELQRVQREKDIEWEERVRVIVEETKVEMQREHASTIRQLEKQHELDLLHQVEAEVHRAVESARRDWEVGAERKDTETHIAHTEALDNLRDELTAANEMVLEQLRQSHQADVQHMKQQHALELETLEHNMIAVHEEKVLAATRSVLEEKDNEIREIRSKHFELMEETEQVHAEKLQSILSDKAAVIERHKALSERLREERCTAERELVAKYEKQIEMILSEHRASLDTAKKQSAVAYGEEKMMLITEYEQRMAGLQEEVRSAAQEEMEEQLRELAERHADDIARLTRDANRDKMAAVDEAVLSERERLTTLFTEKSREAAKSHQQELEAAVELQVSEALQHSQEHYSRLQQAREISQQGERQAALAKLQHAHEEQLAQLRDEQARLQYETEAAYQEKLADDLQALHAELQRKHNEELAALRASLGDEHVAHIAGIRAQHASELRSASEEQQRRTEHRLGELELRLRSEHDDEVRRLEVRHAEAMGRLRETMAEEHSRALAQQMNSSETSLRKQAMEAEEDARRMLQESEGRALVEREAALEKQREELQTRHQEELNSLEAELSSRAREATLLLLRQHENVMQKEKEAAAALLQETLEETRRSIQVQNEARIADLKETLEEQMCSTVTEMEARHKSDMEEATSTLKATHATELQEAVASLRAELEAANAQVMADLRNGHDAELQEAERRHTAEMDRVLGEKDSSVSEMVSGLRSEYEERLESLRQQHEDEKSELEKSLRTEMETALLTLRTELEADFMSRVAQSVLEEKHRAEASFESTLAETLSLQQEDLEQVFEMRLVEALQVQKHEMSAEFVVTLAAKLNDLEESVSEQNQEYMATALAELRAEHESAIAAKEQQFDAQLQAWKQQTEDAHQTDVLAVETRLRAEAAAALEEEKNLYAEEVAILRSAQDDAMQALRVKHEREAEENIIRVVHQHEQDSEARIIAAERALEDALNERHRKELDALATRWSEEIEEATSTLKATHATELQEAVASLRAELEAANAQVMADLRNGHDAELQEAERRHTAEMDRVLGEKDSSVSEMVSGLRSEYEERLESLRQQHEDEKSELEKSLRTEMETALRSLRQHYEDAMIVAVQNERQRMEEIRLQELKELQNEIDVTNTTFEAALSDVEQRHKDNLESSLAGLRQELENTHASNVASRLEVLRRELLSWHEAEVERSEQAWRCEMDDRREAEIRSLSEQHEEALATVAARHQTALDRLTQELNEARVVAVNAMVAEKRQAEEHWRMDMEEQKSRLTKEKEEAVLVLQQHVSRIEEMARVNVSTALNEQLDRLLQHHQRDLEQVREERNTLEVELRAELTRLELIVESSEAARSESNHTTRVAAERISSLELQLQDMQHEQSSLVQKLKQTEVACAEEVATVEDSLRSSHEALVIDLQAKHSQEVSALEIQHRQDLESAHMQLEAATASYLRDIDVQRSRLTSEMSAKWTEKESNLHREYSEELRSLQEALGSARLRLASSTPLQALEELRKGHAEELARSLEDQRRLHEVALERVKEQYSNEILRTTSIHQDELDSMKIQTDRLVDEMKSKVHRLTQDLLDRDASMATLTDRISDQTEEMERREVRSRSMQQEYQSLMEVTQKRFDDAIDEMSRRHAEEVKSLKNMLQAALRRSKDLEEEVAASQVSSQRASHAAMSTVVHSNQMQAMKESYESEISTLKAAVTRLEVNATDAASKSEAAHDKLLAQLTEAQEKLNKSSQQAAADIHDVLIQLKIKHESEMATASQTNAELESSLAEARAELAEIRAKKPVVQVDPALAETMRIQFEKELRVQREKMQNQYLSMLQGHMGALTSLVKSSGKHSSPSNIEGE